MDRRSTVSAEIKASKDRISNMITKVGVLDEKEISRAHSFLNILSVFETEVACQMKAWSRILEVIQVTLPPSYIRSSAQTQPLASGE